MNIPSNAIKYKNQHPDFTKCAKPYEYFITYTPALARIAGGVLAGLLLSRILYWWRYAQIQKDDCLWIANTHDAWEEDLAFSRRELNTAIKNLIDKRLIKKQIYKFNSNPTTHISLNEDRFVELKLQDDELISNKKYRYAQNEQNEMYRQNEKSEFESEIAQNQPNFSSVSEGYARNVQNEMHETCETITKKTNKESVPKGTIHTYAQEIEPVGSQPASLFVSSSYEEFYVSCCDLDPKTRKRWGANYGPKYVIETLKCIHKQYQGKTIKNLPGLIERALQEQWVRNASTEETNRSLAEKFKKQHKLYNLRLDKTGVVHEISGKDISYSLETTRFQEQLLHISEGDRK